MKYISFLVLLSLFSEAFAYRLKDEDVVVVGGIITSCVYDISTRGNVIEIPDILDNQTITGIGDNAFSVAGKIAILTLPSTLKTIGFGVFEGHALTNLVIPDGVISIGGRAFFGNALATINLPAGLETIAEETFANNQLNSITLPGNLKSIGWGAFQNNKITSLTIPKSVLTIGVQAFYGNRISDLNFEAGCQIKEITDNCFGMNDIKVLSIPNSVLIIGISAFYNNQNLKTVSFENGLLKIKRWAFAYCNIVSLNFPESLVFIGITAFEGNVNLNSFKLPVSANNYKWNDSNGDKYNGGDVVTKIYYSYVAIIPYTLTDNDVIVQGGIITGCSYYDDITHTGSVITIPEKLDGQTIAGIGEGVFNDRGISEITLPKGVKEIGMQAFGYNELIKLVIPAGLVSIGTEAFINNSINSLVFEPTSELKVIGMSSFSINRLTTIDFPASVMKIEKFAFESNSIQNITFESNSRLISIGSKAFYNNGLVSFKLPDPKTSYWVDWNNNHLSKGFVVTNFESFYKVPVEYVLTNADVVVVNGVIVSCTLLDPNANILTIPETLDGQKIVGVGNGVFRTFGLIGVNLPSTLQTINYGAFSDNDILKVVIPGSVTKIEREAFYRNNINELVFEASSRLKQVDWGAFYINRITSLTLPDSLTYIYNYAFGNNKIANTLVIPDSVKHIGLGAFGYNQISQLIFGEKSTLAHLGNYAFASNQISNEIHIPKTLTEISDYAFQLNQISKVVVHNNIVEYGKGAFQYNDPSLKIVLHQPPTIPFVTHFFGWKDSNGVYHNQGETIADFSIRYKADIDRFLMVKFVVTDDNNDPVENASVQFYNDVTRTDKNGKVSIGPVMRGFQNYDVSAKGCQGVAGNVNIQESMTVYVTLRRYYNVNITIIDSGKNPIEGAGISLNNAVLTSDTNGKAVTKLTNGEYPYVVNVAGFKALPATFTVHDTDTSIFIVLRHVEVNYFPNNGAGNSITDISDRSNYITQNNSFIRNAYTFSHWNTEADNTGTKYAEKESMQLLYSDVDLYAIWKPVDYIIIYHLDGGTNNSGNPALYNMESELNLLPATKTSLYFFTWLDAANNRVNKIEKGNAGDIELWAVYTTEPTYFIGYHNLENASHANQSIYTKFDLPVAFSKAYRKGYEFLAWFEDSLFKQEIKTIPNGSAKNYDIYAKWGNPVEFTITYNLDGGKNHPANPAGFTIETDKIVFGLPTKTGANFLGWFSDKHLVNKISEIPGGTVGDTKIYAKWELENFNINYVLNGGKNNPVNPLNYTVESQGILFEPASKPGAEFIAWYSDKDLTTKITGIPIGNTGDVSAYAKWKLKDYEIIYVLNGGVNHPGNPSFFTVESKPVTFEPPSKTGAKFIGWYSNKELTKQITGIPTASFGDTTIYASWELDIFDIHYVLNGGKNNLANPTKYTIESEEIILEEPTKNWANFVAWCSDKELTKQITNIPKGSFGDSTIFAKWEMDTFDIQYVLDGGINNPVNKVKYTIESETIVLENPIKEGFIFDGWFTNLDFSNRINSIPGGSEGDMAIYAKWIKIYKVNFVITTDSVNPARGVDIVINNTKKLKSDNLGLADTVMFNGNSFHYSVEISDIVIEDGSVIISGNNVTINVQIVHCYLSSYDVLFCDNGKALWTKFAWFNDKKMISEEQFFYNPGGFKGENYKLVVTSVDGVEYVWEKNYKFIENWEKAEETDKFDIFLFPVPVQRGSKLNITLTENFNLQSCNIFIYNVKGTLIKTFSNPRVINEIDIDGRFTSELYHVIVSDDKNKQRIVKNFIVN